MPKEITEGFFLLRIRCTVWIVIVWIMATQRYLREYRIYHRVQLNEWIKLDSIFRLRIYFCSLPDCWGTQAIGECWISICWARTPCKEASRGQWRKMATTKLWSILVQFGSWPPKMYKKNLLMNRLIAVWSISDVWQPYGMAAADLPRDAALHCISLKATRANEWKNAHCCSRRAAPLELFSRYAKTHGSGKALISSISLPIWPENGVQMSPLLYYLSATLFSDYNFIRRYWVCVCEAAMLPAELLPPPPSFIHWFN